MLPVVASSVEGGFLDGHREVSVFTSGGEPEPLLSEDSF